jgi:hypothetical protein
MHPRTVQQAVTLAARAAGIRKKVTPHPGAFEVGPRRDSLRLIR